MQNDVVYWASSHEGPMPSVRMTDTVVFYKTSFEKRRGVPDMQVVVYNYVAENSNDYSSFSFFPTPYYDQMTILIFLLAPTSQGYLKLDKIDPVLNQPEIHFNYLSNLQDIEALIEGIQILQNITETKVFKENCLKPLEIVQPECEKLKNKSSDYLNCIIRCRYNFGGHPVGTCKMKPNYDSGAVVDPKLRVYGIKGLRVIDASIMPIVPRANTNAPTIMIAEKGGDMIKKEWR